MPADISEVASRISAAVKKAGGTKHVSEITGIPTRTLSHYISGTAEAKASAIAQIAQACGLSADYILFGDTPELASSDGMVFVPRYEIRASAGSGLVPVSEDVAERLPFRRDELRELGVAPDKAGIVTADGDSMEPTIPDGALMLVDLSKRTAHSGGIYVIALDGDLLVKRINRRADGSVELISDNDRYPHERLSKTDLSKLRIAGRVRWVGRPI